MILELYVGFLLMLLNLFGVVFMNLIQQLRLLLLSTLVSLLYLLTDLHNLLFDLRLVFDASVGRSVPIDA